MQVIDVGSKTRSDSLPTKLDYIHDVEFSPAGNRLAVVGGSPAQSGELEIYSWPQRQRLTSRQISDDVIYEVDWSTDGRQLAVATHATDCFLIDTEQYQKQQKWAEHSRPVRSIRFLNDELVVSGGDDMTLRVWSTNQPEAVRSLNNHTAEVHAIAVAPDVSNPRTRLIVSVGQDKTVRFWQPAIGRLVRFARLDSIPLSVEWDHQSRYVVVGCEDGQVLVVDSQTAKIHHSQAVLPGPIYCIARHPKENRFAIGGFKNLWEILEPLVD